MDISLFKNKKLSDAERSRVLMNVWVPENSFDFPIRNYGKQNRKFSHGWLNKYKWLAYSRAEDCAYCKICLLFAPNEGFSNWKHALERFEQHKTLKYHIDATLKADNFLDVMSGKIQPINVSVDTANKMQRLANQEKLKPIINTVILCGRQGIALRGHRDYGEFNISEKPKQNEGNFRALLRERIDSGDSALKRHFESCGRNATYISWNIQNQIIEACDIIIKRKIASDVNQAKYFAVLADETSDISLVEQFSLCVRYVKTMTSGEHKICEHFLQFMPVELTTGKHLADSILSGLKECNINTEFLRGQGYDGAASMSGKFKGAQAYISEKYPTAVYVHCVSHSLNLAISNAVEIPSIRNAFATIGKIYNFFNTQKRQLVLKSNIEQLAPEQERTKLKQLCPTRWVERHDAILLVSQLLTPIAASLEEIQIWDDRASSSDACLLLQGILQSEFIISLLCSEKLFSYTLPLSRMLQTSDSDLCTAVQHATRVISILSDIRSKGEQEFTQLFEEAKKRADSLGTSISLPRLAKKQTMRSNVPADNAETYYRRAIFFPLLDSLVNNVSDRFLKHENLIKKFSILLPTGKAATADEKQQLLSLAEFYNEDIEGYNSHALLAEFDLWYAKFINSASLPKNAIDALNICSRNTYTNVFVLLQIFCTLPVSTSTTERSFSTLRRIKTYLRNTMGESRLNGLANLNIHREIDVDYTEVIKVLNEKGPRRLDFVL